MAKRPKKALPPIADLVPIVGDGSIAGPVAEGVNIPLVILDTSNRPDIEGIIRVHGLSRRKAEPLARQYIKELRTMTIFRMPR